MSLSNRRIRTNSRSRTVTSTALLLAVLALDSQAVVANPAATLAGHWEGAYSRLGSIQTVEMDLVERDGALAGTWSVPELDIIEEPIREIAADSTGISVRLTYGVFAMRVFTDTGEMTGENRRWNPPMALHLKRRPQPAVTPFPQEAVRFTNGAVTLAGTLVKPRDPGPHPAIVIVHGSGDQGRASGRYRFWGEFFARRGLATLIYDKRGVGASGGDYTRATFDDLAGDVRAAIGTLKARADVVADSIGLFGISQGGWIAPLAASRAPDVRFLILDVGPAVSVAHQELDRVAYSMRANEAPEADIEAAVAYMRQVFAAAYEGKGKRALLARADSVARSPWAEYVEPVRLDEDLEAWRRIRYDPAPVLRQTTIPLLALFGELDPLVPPQENEAPMRAYLAEAGNPDVTIRVIPGTAHDMETFGSLRGGDWDWPEHYWIFARRSPAFYDAITSWLSARGIGR
jgi:uncharacterized protein